MHVKFKSDLYFRLSLYLKEVSVFPFRNSEENFDGF